MWRADFPQLLLMSRRNRIAAGQMKKRYEKKSSRGLSRNMLRNGQFSRMRPKQNSRT
jgi:hypothetical protein